MDRSRISRPFSTNTISLWASIAAAPSTLKSDILELTRNQRLDLDVALTGDDDSDLQKLDAFLCELKEAQIRDGLHVLGTSPDGPQETDLLVALARVPRQSRRRRRRLAHSRAAADLGLGDFDPLDLRYGGTVDGPAGLRSGSHELRQSGGPMAIRSNDLELLAAALVSSRSLTRDSAPGASDADWCCVRST